MNRDEKTSGQSDRLNLFFPLTVALVGIFAVTIMAVTAASFGDPESSINVFLNNRMMTILSYEAIGILVTGILAMTVDRRRTLRQRKNDAEETAANQTAADTTKQAEEPLT